MKTVPIVFAFDKNMEMPAGVAIFSLLHNAEEDTFYDIFIIHSENTDFSRSAILKLPELFPNCKISFRCVRNEFEGVFETRGITEATYYRLLIPVLVPEYDIVLYSDVDVIFREDLSKYLEISLDGYYFAAVNSAVVMNEDNLNYIKSNGFSTEIGYYYAGNLVINSRMIREKNKTADFKRLFGKKLRLQDMDIINITCAGQIKPLPPAFCLSFNYYWVIIEERDRLTGYFSDEQIEYALRYGIVHYNGAKPWNTACMNMDIWWEYYRKSIFFDERFNFDFWNSQTDILEKMSLMKRIKLVGRYFRKGGRK